MQQKRQQQFQQQLHLCQFHLNKFLTFSDQESHGLRVFPFTRTFIHLYPPMFQSIQKVPNYPKNLQKTSKNKKKRKKNPKMLKMPKIAKMAKNVQNFLTCLPHDNLVFTEPPRRPAPSRRPPRPRPPPRRPPSNGRPMAKNLGYRCMEARLGISVRGYVPCDPLPCSPRSQPAG